MAFATVFGDNFTQSKIYFFQNSQILMLFFGGTLPKQQRLPQIAWISPNTDFPIFGPVMRIRREPAVN